MDNGAHKQPRDMSIEEMEQMLARCPHGRLGLAVDAEPYVAPVSHGYRRNRVYFHSPKQGKKVEFLKKNSRVCFEVDEYSRGWGSVLCYGTAALREDIGAKREFFQVLMGEQPSDEQLEHMDMYIGIIQVDEMTGRCSADFSP